MLLIVVLGLLVATGLILFAAEQWLFHTWGALDVDELVFHINSSIKGTNPEMIRDFILHYAIYAIAGVVLFIITMIASRRKKALRAIMIFLWIAVSLGLLEYALYDSDNRIGLLSYLIQNNETTRHDTGDFIYDNYVDADTAEITFPEKKRNLVYIYLESMEITYADRKSGGAFSRNTIPELTKIAQKNEDFSGSNRTLNGGVSLPGTTWTIGAIFGQSTAMPLKLPAVFHQDIVGVKKDFFSGLTGLGDLLDREGYHQVFMIGSDAEFGARDTFFKLHGDFDIFDYDSAKKTGVIPQDYFVFWGFEDSILFSEAKKKLTELSEEEQPFNLTLLTVDTHFEDGYICDLCDDSFGDNQYANVMACSSRQVAELVQWIQEQPFYENTTIILSGDHPTMDLDFCQNVPDTYQRKTYTAIINSAAKPEDPNRERLYSTMDLYPTTVAALGATIRGNRLGLGTNLYSSASTMLEMYGVEACVSSMNKPSRFMDTVYYGAASEETIETAASSAILSTREEADGTVTFMLRNAESLSMNFVDAAVLEITESSGKTVEIEMEFQQSKTDPSVYWCLADTDYTPQDLKGMRAKVYFDVKGYQHYYMASWRG